MKSQGTQEGKPPSRQGHSLFVQLVPKDIRSSGLGQ